MGTLLQTVSVEAHTYVDLCATSPLTWVCRDLSFVTMCCDCSSLTVRVQQSSRAVPHFLLLNLLALLTFVIHSLICTRAVHYSSCALSAGLSWSLQCSPGRWCEVGMGVQQRCAACLLV